MFALLCICLLVSLVACAGGLTVTQTVKETQTVTETQTYIQTQTITETLIREQGQFLNEMLDILSQDNGWVLPLPPDGGQQPRILTREEILQIRDIVEALPQVIETRQNEEVFSLETHFQWIGWNGNPEDSY